MAYKYDLKNSEPGQEFLGAMLFGMFILPWLLITGMMTLISICVKISEYKDKKDPSRLLDREARYFGGNWKSRFSFWTQNSNGEENEVFIDFGQIKTKQSVDIKDLYDYQDLIDKRTRFAKCVDEIGGITELKDAGQQIQKIFAKYFKNGELFDQKDKKWKGVRIQASNVKYPNSPWFKAGAIEKFCNTQDDIDAMLKAAFTKMAETSRKCLEAPKTYKDDKDRCLGALNYLKTIEVVCGINDSLWSYIDQTADKLIRVFDRLSPIE